MDQGKNPALLFRPGFHNIRDFTKKHFAFFFQQDCIHHGTPIKKATLKLLHLLNELFDM
jgi:hypothetical protein